MLIWKTDAERKKKIMWETPKVGVCCGDRAQTACETSGVWLCLRHTKHSFVWSTALYACLSLTRTRPKGLPGHGSDGTSKGLRGRVLGSGPGIPHLRSHLRESPWSEASCSQLRGSSPPGRDRRAERALEDEAGCVQNCFSILVAKNLTAKTSRLKPHG